MRILLIDDDQFALTLLERQLDRLGFPEVMAFESGIEAVTHLEYAPSRPDLVFCDLQMPQMDGVEVVRHLVRLGYAGALVLVSGEDTRIIETAYRVARGHGLHVLGSLRKPVEPGALCAIMEGTFARHATATHGPKKQYSPQELALAIARGELVNFYQPKVEIHSCELVGVETLVRWRHPGNGLVMPDDFIAMAEESGLIDELTHHVLNSALRQSRRWQDAGLGLQIAVNVSMENLVSLEFPDRVERAALEAGQPLQNLMLEVTESRLMDDVLTPLEILTRLRLKRIGLSIDDFGMGHSSLAQLRDIPFTELKVDRSFVHGACRDASLRAIFEASLAMARQLGMRSVAEGVENREDWDFLRGCGCDLAQGYFIGVPMPGEELDRWMLGWGKRRAELLGAGP
ncbi:MAG: EAL domain-containing response regulator [Betaproteobacteria bacterium]|nr:EAL domain-containing response regulator [Betaproteobacteria bacterium]